MNSAGNAIPTRSVDKRPEAAPGATNEECLRPGFQRKLIDYLFRGKVIICLVLLVVLVFFHYFQILEVRTGPVALVLLLELAVFTAYFPVRARKPEWVLFYNKASIFLDVLAVTVALHYFGGIYALIWVVDYMLLVAVYSLFLNRRERLALIFFTLTSYSLLCLFEHSGVLARHNIFQVPVSPGMDLNCWITSVVLILLAALIANNFVEMLVRTRRFADLGRLSTELAHEIRTPLQVIEGVTSREGVPESARQEIRSQVDRIGRFIREVMSLGRDEKQHLSRVLLQDLADVSVSNVFKSAQTAHIRLDKRFDGDDLWVRVDVDQMVRALSNLVRNGVDSMDQAGVLEVKVRRAGFEWARVAVCDTGRGMEKHELGRIFEPFYTTKTGMRGVGLGLAIARKFVEANGGKIEVESRAGEGSRFTVWVPLDAGDGDPPVDPEA